MSCEICKRSGCTRSFHSIDEQNRFDAGVPDLEETIADLSAKLAEAEEVHDKASKEFNAAINHAISLNLDAAAFLYAWREGNWKGCKEFGFNRTE